jgi:hypothetical protein
MSSTPAMPYRRDILDNGEDVTGWSERDLLLRCINAQLALAQELGAVVRRIAELETKRTRDAEDLTIVRTLRQQLRSTRRTALGVVAGVLVIVIAAYICKRLGLVPLG